MRQRHTEHPANDDSPNPDRLLKQASGSTVHVPLAGKHSLLLSKMWSTFSFETVDTPAESSESSHDCGLDRQALLSASINRGA
jgi:hypothetical protein